MLQEMRSRLTPRREPPENGNLAGLARGVGADPRRGSLRLAAALLVALWSLAGAAEARTVVLCDSHNPPYSLGREDGGVATGGSIVALAKAAFARLEGHDVEVRLMPWARCLKAAEAGEVDGVLKLLPTSERRAFLEFTQPIYESVQRLYYLATAFPSGFSWGSVADLGDYRLGVVRGSSYGGELGAAIAAGELPVETVNEDLQNFRMLLAGRVDLVPMNELMARGHLRELGAEQTILPADPPYHVAEGSLGLSRRSAAVELLPAIDAVLAELREDGTYDRLLSGD